MSETQPGEVGDRPPAAPRASEPDAPLRLLGGFERFAFRLLRWANSRGGKLPRLWQRCVLAPLFWVFIGRRLEIRGAERLRGIPRDAPLFVVANHRTFFDLFTVTWVLWRRLDLDRRINFPVRANFFYSNPLGFLIGLVFSGGAMFPPFFREPKKREFNRISQDLIVERLHTPGWMVGFHPEGTRSKSDSPYELLRAQPGAGQIALEARPIVVPVFLTGLSNSLGAQVLANLRRRSTIVLVFGAPFDLTAFPDDGRVGTGLRCSQAMLQRIGELGEEETAIRAELAAR